MVLMTANRITVLAVLAVLACALLLAGVVISKAQMSGSQQVAASQVTMSDVDNALQKGPVFIEFETKECGYCKQQHPISQELADEYRGKVTFFFVDAQEDRDLAKVFQVTGVPQMDIIASKSNGKYTYINSNAVASDSIGSSKIEGLTQKDTLKPALDAAVRTRG